MKILIPGAILVAILTAAFFLSIPTKSAPALASDEVDYVRQLPNPTDLFNNKGAPDGATVTKIVQTRSEVAVTYAYNNGQVRTVTYRLLPASGSLPQIASAPAAPDAGASPAFDDAAAAAPAVIQQPAPVYFNNSGPSNSVVYQQPQPAAAPNYDTGAAYAAAYAPPPATVYYDTAPSYPVTYQQPAPVYGYYPPYNYGYGYGYYAPFPAVIVGVTRGVGVRGAPLSGGHVETRGGFHGSFNSGFHGSARR
jgi:hypothetical protein